MYTDNEIIKALASNNKTVLEKLSVYILLKNQNIDFNCKDIKEVNQTDPSRLDVTYKDCNFQIKEVINLQNDCLLDGYNGNKKDMEQASIDIDRRAKIYKIMLQGKEIKIEAQDVFWFDLGKAVYNVVQKAIDLYTDINIRRNMDLFIILPNLEFILEQ